jgi:7-carboxy-7-deazaguanine synthase
MRNRTVPVSEIFGPTLQGEGELAGFPSLFIRLGGCDYRCVWCDTLYSVLPEYRHEWKRMDFHTIMEQVNRLAPPPVWVTLSGGNPAIYDLSGLVSMLREQGYRVACETQGSIACDWFRELDRLVLSPKPPSAGNVTSLEEVAHALSFAPEKTVLKVVVFDREDYLYARGVVRALPHLPAILQIGTPLDLKEAEPLVQHYRDMTARLLNWLQEDGLYEVRVLPQLHRILFEAERGV